MVPSCFSMMPRRARKAQVPAQLFEGEEDRERSACPAGPHAADEVNGALVLFNDAASDPQAEASPAFALGGVERREQVLTHPRRDAVSVVEHSHTDSLALRVRGPA